MLGTGNSRVTVLGKSQECLDFGTPFRDIPDNYTQKKHPLPGIATMTAGKLSPFSSASERQKMRVVPIVKLSAYFDVDRGIYWPV